jgi:hypothetical protein
MNYTIVNTTEGVPKLLQGDVCETEFSHIESCNKKQVEELIKLKSIIKNYAHLFFCRTENFFEGKITMLLAKRREKYK